MDGAIPNQQYKILAPTGRNVIAQGKALENSVDAKLALRGGVVNGHRRPLIIMA